MFSADLQDAEQGAVVPTRTMRIASSASARVREGVDAPGPDRRLSSDVPIICRRCRQGLFSAENLPQALSVKGFQYASSCICLRKSSQRGCGWCSLLFSAGVKTGIHLRECGSCNLGSRSAGKRRRAGPEASRTVLRIRVATTLNGEALRVNVGNREILVGNIYTAAGVSARYRL